MNTKELEEALKASFEIMRCNDMNMPFLEYSQGFFGATEDIKGYLREIDYNKDRALTVLSSGDHVFNLIHQGVREIDAFDINKLQYYVYYLRRAFILAVPFEFFLILNKTFASPHNLDEKLSILKKIKKQMPEEVYVYFRLLIEYEKRTPKAHMRNLWSAPNLDMNANYFLDSQEDYLKLRKKMNEVQVNLYFANALDVPNMVAGGYDLILLSNIADYLYQTIPNFNFLDFGRFIDKYKDIMNDGGVLVNYLYGMKRQWLISNAYISKYDLGVSNVHEISRAPLNGAHGYYLVRK